MKFGFEYHHTLFHGLGAPGNIDGTLNYSAGGSACPNCTDLQNFLAGNITNGQLLVNPLQEDTSVGFNRYGFYFEDNFRDQLQADRGLGAALRIGACHAGRQ